MRNQLTTCSVNRKAQKPSSSNNSIDSEKKFDCSLSPISFPLTCMKAGTVKEPVKRFLWRKKLDVKKELRNFSLKFGAAVGTLILSKLSPKGVLEDALEALRQLENPVRFEFSSGNAVAVREKMTFVFPEENKVSFCEDFLSIMDEGNFFEGFAMNQLEEGDAKHSSHLTIIDNDEENEKETFIKFQVKDFRKPVKKFNVVTPPIYFFRRNMF